MPLLQWMHSTSSGDRETQPLIPTCFITWVRDICCNDTSTVHFSGSPFTPHSLLGLTVLCAGSPCLPLRNACQTVSAKSACVKDDLVYLDLDGKIILKCIQKMEMGVETEFIQFRIGITKVLFEHDSEPSYINNGEINSTAEWALASHKGQCLQCWKYNDTTHTILLLLLHQALNFFY